MDNIKEAFQKVKQDIDSLKFEMTNLNLILTEIKWNLEYFNRELKQIKEFNENLSLNVKKLNPSNAFINPAHNPAHPADPAHNMPFKTLKDHFYSISTGNEGVPADRQTNQQTDIQHIPPQKTPSKEYLTIPTNPIENAAEILDSLDVLKKEIRLKFKKLTEQEVSVFSALYQLDEEKGYADYKLLAQKLNLTESSIRDYISRITLKGIPLEKQRINNKTIHLKIPQNLKKIASLSTILQLRDI